MAQSFRPGNQQETQGVTLAAASISHDGSRIAVAPETSFGNAPLSVGPLASLFRLEAADVVGVTSDRTEENGGDK